MTDILIEDMCDGFAIEITEDGETERYYFDQEDTRERLKDVFEFLRGRTFDNISYEEVY